jgi:hypothetical protein
MSIVQNFEGAPLKLQRAIKSKKKKKKREKERKKEGKRRVGQP